MVWYAVDSKARKKKGVEKTLRRVEPSVQWWQNVRSSTVLDLLSLRNNLVSLGCVTDRTGVGKGVVENFECYVASAELLGIGEGTEC